MGKASRKRKHTADKNFSSEILSRSSAEPAGRDNRESSGKTGWLPIIIILLVSFAVYSNTLLNGFVWDDTQQVLDNPWIKDIKYIPEVFFQSVWGFTGQESNYYRPFMHIFYMFDYYIFGLRPWGFHLGNILLHAGASILVFLIITRLPGNNMPAHAAKDSAADIAPPSPPLNLGGGWAGFLSPPFMAAILFATHPIHTDAVAWVAALPDLSYSFFFLLSLYLYIRSDGGTKGIYLSSLLCFFIAAFSKEPALTLPFVLIAYDYVFKNRTYRSYKSYIPYFVIAGVYLGLRYHALGGFAPKRLNIMLSTYGYIINAFPLFIQYLKYLLLPVNLNAFHVLHPISSIMELKGILSLTLTAIFAAITFIALKKKSKLSFSLLIIALPLLPALYIPAIGAGGNVSAERYLYLPSFGFVLMIAWLLLWSKAVKPRLTFGLVMFFLVVAVSYSIVTVNRNVIWKDEFSFFSDTVKKSPDSSTMHYNLGVVYRKQNRLPEAINEYIAALKLNPDDFEVHKNLGAAYLRQNRLPEAENECMAAIKLKPDFPEAHYNLGVIYSNQNRLSEAEKELVTALRLNPDYPEAHNNLGTVYGMRNRPDEAINEFIAALKLKPEFPNAHNNLGYMYLKQSRFNEAANEFIAALRLDPDLSIARENLNICYEKMKTMK